MPPHLRHSPKRPIPGSVGLVVENARRAGEKDGFRMVLFRLRRAPPPSGDCRRRLRKRPAAALCRLYADRSARTCESAGACIPEKRRCRDGRSFPTEGELRNSDFQKLQLRGPGSRGNRPRLLLQCVNAEPFSVFTRRLGSKAAAANASAAPFGMHDSALRI